MTFATLLITSVTTSRYTTASQDGYGNPVKTWTDELENQDCRISYPKGRQIMRDTELTPVDAVLFMEDVDVIVSDRAVVDSVTYEIAFVKSIQNGSAGHHLELDLIRIIE